MRNPNGLKSLTDIFCEILEDRYGKKIISAKSKSTTGTNWLVEYVVDGFFDEKIDIIYSTEVLEKLLQEKYPEIYKDCIK